MGPRPWWNNGGAREQPRDDGPRNIPGGPVRIPPQNPPIDPRFSNTLEDINAPRPGLYRDPSTNSWSNMPPRLHEAPSNNPRDQQQWRSGAVGSNPISNPNSNFQYPTNEWAIKGSKSPSPSTTKSSPKPQLPPDTNSKEFYKNNKEWVFGNQRTFESWFNQGGPNRKENNFTGKSLYQRTTPEESWEMEKAAARGDQKAKNEIARRLELGLGTKSMSRPALDRLHGKTDSPAIREAAEFAKSGKSSLNNLAQNASAGNAGALTQLQQRAAAGDPQAAEAVKTLQEKRPSTPSRPSGSPPPNQQIKSSASPSKPPTAEEMAAEMDKRNRAREMAAQAAAQREAARKAAENQAARDAAARKMGFPNAAEAEKAGAKIGNIGDKLPIGGGGGGGGKRGGNRSPQMTAKERNDLAAKRAAEAARREDMGGLSDSAYAQKQRDAQWKNTPKMSDPKNQPSVPAADPWQYNVPQSDGFGGPIPMPDVPLPQIGSSASAGGGGTWRTIKGRKVLIA